MIVEDYDLAPIAPLGFGLAISVRLSRALVPMGDGRWIEVSADGVVQEPRGCTGLSFARAEGTDILHCTDIPRTLVLDRVMNTERLVPALEGVSGRLFRGFDSESSWAFVLEQLVVGGPAQELHFLDPETLDVVSLPADDPELGPVIDGSFRHPAQIL